MAVDCRFQHHLIIRVAQAGPPQKMGFHGFDQGGHAVQKHLRVGGTDAGRLLVFGPAAHRFIFDDQRYVRNQRDAAIHAAGQFVVVRGDQRRQTRLPDQRFQRLEALLVRLQADEATETPAPKPKRTRKPKDQT